MLWGFGGGGVALFGYAAYFFIGETLRAARSARRPRQPWEVD